MPAAAYGVRICLLCYQVKCTQYPGTATSADEWYITCPIEGGVKLMSGMTKLLYQGLNCFSLF